MSAVFVTATGTDVGKTFVSTGMVRALRLAGQRAEAIKPVLSGFNMDTASSSDSGRLLAALGRGITAAELDEISPWRFAAPLSPDMAARLEGKSIDFETLLAFSRDCIAKRKGPLLIEGVGGVMVPLDDSHTVLDWMAELDLPVLLVAGSYLGTISHTLTALDVLIRRGLTVMSVVVSESAASTVGLDETVSAIRRLVPSPQDVIAIPRLSEDTPNHPTMDRLAARLYSKRAPVKDA